MEYITPKQCSEQWGISTRAIQNLCSMGKISGAKQVGKMWLIPFNATKPIDGRTKKGKHNKLIENYRFPLFIFSDLYSSTNVLTDEEDNLRYAQILYLEAKYEDSLILCQQIINSTMELHVKFGAYVTIAYNTMLLQLAGEFNSTIQILNKLIDNAIYNKEDYKLIYAGLIYHLSWDSKHLPEINIDELSYQSLAYYQYIMTLSNIINMMPLSKQTVGILSTLNKSSYINKIEPLNIMFDFLLAFIYLKDGNKNECTKLIKTVCDVCIKNNWNNYFSKFYAMLSSMIDNYVYRINAPLLKEIKKLTNSSVLSWRIISKAYNGGTTLDNIPIDLFDIMILIARNKSNKEISSIKNLSDEIIKSKIDDLMKITNSETRKDLIAYAKKQFEKFKEQ